MKRTLFASALLAISAVGFAQLARAPFAGGFVQPVQFAADPTVTGRTYVVEQGGTVRMMDNGVATGTFLSIPTAELSLGGERGLLGMTFAPDYATSGHVYVNITNQFGDNQILRFTRNGDTLDYSTKHSVILVDDPYSNHNGGRIEFGADGFLYLSFGDGGSGFDPEGRAQNTAELLGKFLRIDPSGDDFGSDPDQNYAIPTSNPFFGADTLNARDEIWSFGWRNPYSWGFDNFGPDATNAFIAGDVGQDNWEEINYEPFGAGGRNYGWVVREGAHNTGFGSAAYTPLTDPIFEYDHGTGETIIGGHVYRGAFLPDSFRGRYFFADFITRRLWSLGLTVDGGGEATAGDLQEHTSALGPLGMISSIDLDANGELYVVEYDTGQVFRIGTVPEPTTWLALAGGLALLRRRKR